MWRSLAKKKIRTLLASADIRTDGSRPSDIKVNDERFYRRVITGGSLALGESYMDGWWDCEQLDEFFDKAIRAGLDRVAAPSWYQRILSLKARLTNLQSVRRALRVAREHYDLGNDLYTAFLDPYNQYTCGYFKDTRDLNQAQEAKLDLMCRKLQLKKSDHVLDIGCGWGGFAKWAAEHYGCQVTGVSISDEQIKYAREFTKGLPVNITKQDYRNLTGQFNKVLICGMIEHVGYKNYRTIMETVWRVLEPDGLFLLHTIGSNTSETIGDPWSDRYIFPNSMLPSPVQLSKASEGLFVMEDWHNFGQYYDPTLMAWWRNFQEVWPRFSSRYGARFYRMWKYYLLSFAGAFRARKTQLWQIVFSKGGTPGGYVSVR